MAYFGLGDPEGSLGFPHLGLHVCNHDWERRLRLVRIPRDSPQTFFC